jgi:hypothetical protein
MQQRKKLRQCVNVINKIKYAELCFLTTSG